MTWGPATQACTLTGNRTRDPMVHKLALNPLSYTSQGHLEHFMCNTSLVFKFFKDLEMCKKKKNTNFSLREYCFYHFDIFPFSLFSSVHTHPPHNIVGTMYLNAMYFICIYILSLKIYTLFWMPLLSCFFCFHMSVFPCC